MDHYAALGVEHDASPDEIKQAYRRQASGAHPDKGGSDKAMAEINRAYEVLGDMERRTRYDETGEDAAPASIEAEASELVMTWFAQAIDSDVGEFLAAAQQQCRSERTRIKGATATIAKRIAQLQTRHGKIHHPGETNAAHMVIDQMMRSLQAAAAQMERQGTVIDAAGKLLPAYTSSETKPVRDDSQLFADLGFSTARMGQRPW